MAKRYFTILKTDQSVENFSKNFELVKKTFAGLESVLATTATDPTKNTDLKALRSATVERLEKIAGITKSSLTYAGNHETDGLCHLSKESIATLKEIQTCAKEEIESLEFIFEQASDLFVLTEISSGNPIPTIADPEPESITAPDEAPVNEG